MASERILKLMDKGVTIEQVTRVCRAFRDAKINVNAYLMYGFPTQTEQEIVDALEVTRQFVRQPPADDSFLALVPGLVT